MDVDLRPKMLHAQRGTFDVPTRPALTPRRIPANVAIGGLPLFPKHEIADAFLFVFVLVHASAGNQVREVEMAEAAILRERSDAKINRAVIGNVSRFLVDELLDQSDHRRDVIGRVGCALGNLDVQCLRILEKCLPINAGEFLQRQFRFARTADRFVIDVGELHDVIDLVSEMFQRAAQEIDRDVGAKISNVTVIVDRRAADVEADALAGRIERLELRHRTGHRIIELKRRAGHGTTPATSRRPRPWPLFPRRGRQSRVSRSWSPLN